MAKKKNLKHNGELDVYTLFNVLTVHLRYFMSCRAKAWKFKRALLQNEGTEQAKYLQNVDFSEDLSSDKDLRG